MILVGSALAVALIWRSVVVVPEGEMAIVTVFGKPIRTITDAGLHAKSPLASRVRFDKRVLIYDPRAAEFLTRDKKNLVVDSAVCWRIVDPLRFLQTASDRGGAELRLHDIVWATLAAAIGRVELSELISVNADSVRVDEIMGEVRRVTDGQTRSGLGIEIVDVQLKRLNFPEQNRQSVFARMRAERDRIAEQYRAEGEEMAIKIRAQADKEREIILAEAYREAETLKGEGDAEAARIYGQAYAASPAFYKFLRTLESYKKILDEQTTIILSSDSDYFRLLTEGNPLDD